jgi:hypothetical protein
MDRKERDDFASGIYQYAQVERALAATLGADAATQKGALRGRLKRLGSLGLPSSAPGKGTRRSYSLEEINQLLIALLMEDAGLDPVVVAAAVKTTWRHLARNIRLATEKAATTNPMMLHLQLQTFTGPWNDKARDPRAALPWIGLNPRIDERAKAKYRDHGFRDESDNVLMMLDRNEPGWFAVRNYTAEALKLQAALSRE